MGEFTRILCVYMCACMCINHQKCINVVSICNIYQYYCFSVMRTICNFEPYDGGDIDVYKYTEKYELVSNRKEII